MFPLPLMENVFRYMRKNCIFGQGLSQEGRAVEYYINRLHALLSHKHILR